MRVCKEGWLVGWYQSDHDHHDHHRQIFRVHRTQSRGKTGPTMRRKLLSSQLTHNNQNDNGREG